MLSLSFGQWVFDHGGGNWPCLEIKVDLESIASQVSMLKNLGFKTNTGGSLAP